VTLKPPAPAFGSVIGTAPGGVQAYASDYAGAEAAGMTERDDFRHYVGAHYMGYKWQCVEFARRWLYVNRGWLFEDVPMAFDIFQLRHIKRLSDSALLPLRAFRNGAARHPEPGCLLIWEEGGEFEHTGHVAIATEVTPEYIRFAEQNYDHQPWPDGQDYARELTARVSEDGGYWVECSFGDANFLGWMLQTDDDAQAETFEPPPPSLLDLQLHECPDNGRGGRAWLNPANPDEAAYISTMGGHRMSSEPTNARRYFAMTESCRDEIKRAGNALHAQFMHATHHVLHNEHLLENFNIPRALWPNIHRSWNSRRNQMITGRFDFSVSARGIKVYEYNCDSASCYMETGKVQGKWARHFDCDHGDDAGEDLHEALVAAWRNSAVDGLLHIMQDDDPEETYHALFMQEAMERAGIRSTVIQGVDGLAWDAAGNIVDAAGETIRWVWKTWAWESALDQIRAECNDDEALLTTYQPGAVHDGPPRLVDVLLRKDVMVYEPLWTLIPSNKAILPVLWSLFPESPYLLETGCRLTPALEAGGYVAKPIAGRCGANISIVDPQAGVVKATSGRFDWQDTVYQALWPLPHLGGYHAQLCSFSVNAAYAGSCVRIDATPVIDKDSDLLPLRVVPDRDAAG
jgi:glutathionylspermidine amidase/synthetase